MPAVVALDSCRARIVCRRLFPQINYHKLNKILISFMQSIFLNKNRIKGSFYFLIQALGSNMRLVKNSSFQPRFRARPGGAREPGRP
ncbi:MAG: hypothetical protein LAT81_05935 [Oceanicaulis sp.]|nr:hypothetical protein [Oceanicaulis sp.]